MHIQKRPIKETYQTGRYHRQGLFVSLSHTETRMHTHTHTRTHTHAHTHTHTHTHTRTHRALSLSCYKSLLWVSFLYSQGSFIGLFSMLWDIMCQEEARHIWVSVKSLFYRSLFYIYRALLQVSFSYCWTVCAMRRQGIFKSLLYVSFVGLFSIFINLFYRFIFHIQGDYLLQRALHVVYSQTLTKQSLFYGSLFHIHRALLYVCFQYRGILFDTKSPTREVFTDTYRAVIRMSVCV